MSESELTPIPPVAVQLPNPIHFAVVLGLAAGLAEIALVGVARFGLHRYPVYRGAHSTWTTSVSLALLLMAIALPFSVIDRGPRRTVVRTAAVGALAYAAAFDLLLLATRLHWLARVILAIGLAASVIRLWRNNPVRSERWLRRGTRLLPAVVLLLAIGTFALLRLQDARREGALPAFDKSAPNVLLLILDTVRAADMSLYGYPRPTTPELSQLATRGVVFDRALSTSSWTLPSHASMFTGRWATELSTDWKSPLDRRDSTLAEILSRRGYRTAGFIANIFYATAESGLARGFVHYEDYRLTIGTIALASAVGQYLGFNETLRSMLHWSDFAGRKSASDLRQDISRWVRDHPDRPFFVFANYYDAHHPYSPPAPYDTLFTGRQLRWKDRDRIHNPGKLPPPQIVRNEKAMYDGAIASIDLELARLLADLAASGTLRNTIVVVTADHGEEFGEHGLLDHGHSLYLQSLRVPLIIVAPHGVPADARVQQWVSLRDLAATILDLAGLPASVPGRSLARYWNGTATADTLFAETRRVSGLPATIPATRGDLKSAFGGDWRLITTGKSEKELFDLSIDSAETRNRIQDAPIPLARLGEALRHGPSRRPR